MTEAGSVGLVTSGFLQAAPVRVAPIALVVSAGVPVRGCRGYMYCTLLHL